jgi:DNA-binding NarL/FixJ family response regulator
MRVLIVEDELTIALDIEAIVLADGHEVVGIARTEKEALELAPEAEIALVDFRLADGLTGRDLARKLFKGFNIAVIYVTGNPEAVVDGGADGVGVVSKPQTPEKIIEAIRLAAAWRNGRTLKELQHAAKLKDPM